MSIIREELETPPDCFAHFLLCLAIDMLPRCVMSLYASPLSLARK